MPDAQQSPPWHALDPDAVLRELDSRQEGLSDEEAAGRLARHGPNRLRRARCERPLVRLLRQFDNVLIYVLLISAGITFAMGHVIDGAVILGVVVINAIIGFLQEGKAEQALEAIRSMLSPEALVERSGRRQAIPAERLVPGDIVLLQSGDKVPADLRLLRVTSLRCDEAALTGESVPVAKAVEGVDAQAPLGDRRTLAFAGTLVTYGQALGVVVATGSRTEIGRISEMLGSVVSLQTPLLVQIGGFARAVAAAVLIVALATFAFGWLVRDYAVSEMFLAAVGLAVAAIPEGLPAILTITLAIGVQRMAARNAIIRRLPAVDTLGSVTVICSDKTGTLTRNEMMVAAVALHDRTLQVSGSGYAPEGGFADHGSAIDPAGAPALNELARAGLLCNEARLHHEQGAWHLAGDPTEGALISLALKTGLEPQLETAHWPRVDAIPFESEHRFMATLHHDHEGRALLCVKGAPERVLAMCASEGTLEAPAKLRRERWERAIESFASDGQRTLAIAARMLPQHQHGLHFEDCARLVLLGLVGMIDPPRTEVQAAVAECRSAGIAVKMITGDHVRTAAAIGAQLGIGDGTGALSGPQLDAMDDAALRDAARRSDVFARVSPEHKLRLVDAVQADGQVVAMTGDGVNDAPALKRASVGVAMGAKGTEVAKEAADVVLADDNFASIVHAVREGRTVYDNLRKSILFILPTNGGEALVVVLAIAAGQELPLTPVQILWVNMVTAVTLALSLAFEPPEHDVMRRPPRIPGEPLLPPYFLWRIPFVAVLMCLGTYGVFVFLRGEGVPVEESRSVAVNMLVFLEVFYLFNCRAITGSILGARRPQPNRWVWIAIGVIVILQLLYTYLPLSQRLFGMRDVPLRDWLVIGAVGLALLVLVEVEKVLVRWALKQRTRDRVQPPLV